MNLKNRFKGERLISLFSLVIGAFLFFYSLSFISGYYLFKSTLVGIIVPMVTLIPELLLGILLMISSRLITKQDYSKASILNRLTGMLIVLAPLNFYILNKIHKTYYEEAFLLLLFPYGILLLLFFYRKRYVKKITNIFYSLLIHITLAIIIYAIINLIFFDWQYY